MCGCLVCVCDTNHRGTLEQPLGFLGGPRFLLGQRRTGGAELRGARSSGLSVNKGLLLQACDSAPFLFTLNSLYFVFLKLIFPPHEHKPHCSQSRWRPPHDRTSQQSRAIPSGRGGVDRASHLLRTTWIPTEGPLSAGLLGSWLSAGPQGPSSGAFWHCWDEPGHVFQVRSPADRWPERSIHACAQEAHVQLGALAVPSIAVTVKLSQAR